MHIPALYRTFALSTLLRYSSAKVGISFTGAGLCTPFHLGVSSLLKERGVLTNAVTVAGSSGGALAAVTAALNIDQSEALQACVYVAGQCRLLGARGTLRVALDSVLTEMLPFDAASILNDRVKPCILAYAEIYPKVGSRIVYSFRDKLDLLDVMRASCNIPFYFNGNTVTVPVRGAVGVDGFFAMNFTRLGAPPTAAELEIIVCPFRPRLVGLRPMPAILSSAVEQTVNVISPALLQPDQWSFTVAETIELALLPPSSSLVQRVSTMLERAPTSPPQLECMQSYNGKAGVDLVYTYVYNCGALAAHEWYLNRHKVASS